MFGAMLIKAQQKEIAALKEKCAAQENLINAQRENIETSNKLIKVQEERIVELKGLVEFHKANGNTVRTRLREMHEKYGHGKETSNE